MTASDGLTLTYPEGFSQVRMTWAAWQGAPLASSAEMGQGSGGSHSEPGASAGASEKLSGALTTPPSLGGDPVAVQDFL